MYHHVKCKWNLGHVRCRPFKCFICNGVNWKDVNVTSDTVYHEKVFGS